MPNTTKPKKLLIIGSGPIVIGQAAEFDYSGAQACLSAREERVETILLNSNPATIQTDPDIADKVYIEPLKPEIVEKIIAKEKPDSALITVGGQTGLNLGSKCYELGIFQKYNVQLLGTNYDSIKLGEDRGEFKNLMEQIGQPVLSALSVSSVEQGMNFAKEIGFPVILRVAYTLGGTGGNTAFDEEDLKKKLAFAIESSPVGQVLMEKSVLGWGEFEYEMIRDGDGNKLVICNMENIDPMGVHTGESTVVAPSQTLSDRDHQMMRTAALEIVEALDIRGGCNVQFAFDYATGDYYVIEVNPRLSRSSALASKATGYPIAKVATKIALGKTLPEITNDITGKTAFFEPALDYVVIKIPRWPDDKFPEMDRQIGVTMKSTGEVMAIGRDFEEAMLKAIDSLDVKYDMWPDIPPTPSKGGEHSPNPSQEGNPPLTPQEGNSSPASQGGQVSFEGDLEDVKIQIQNPKEIEERLKIPNTRRFKFIFTALAGGFSTDKIAELTMINPWFVRHLKALFDKKFSGGFDYFETHPLTPSQEGEDLQNVDSVESIKNSQNPSKKLVYKMVDTCSGEFEARTPYFYSTYGDVNEATEKLYYQHEANYDYLLDKAKKDGRELVLDALIFNSEGKVFIQKRKENRKFLPNCWGIVGGHLRNIPSVSLKADIPPTPLKGGEHTPNPSQEGNLPLTPQGGNSSPASQGGQVSFEEDLEHISIASALNSIIKDETGWELNKIKSLLEIRDWEFEGVKKRTIVFDVEVKGDLNAPKLEMDKVNGYLWISKNELPLFYENKNYDEQLMYKVCKKGLEMHNDPKKVIILGSGPIRIGQGVEFDYLTVHAVRALQKKGIKAIIVNNNPETVSTDYSTSDRLYFEPLTPKYVKNIIQNEKEGLLGVIAQFGGQTAISLAAPLEEAGVNVLGTTAGAIDLAEDREKTGEIMKRLGYKMPEWGIAHKKSELMDQVHKIGYPVLLRPSFVLGGDGMKIVYSDKEVEEYLEVNFGKNSDQLIQRVETENGEDMIFAKPLLIDKFLENATEVDVDFITDGNKTYSFILEQLEKAGIHSGDSSCVFPAQSISREIQDKLVEITRKIAKEFGVIGIGNVQMAIQNGEIYVIEVNPRASRTVPFVSKCLGFSLTEMATNVIMGDKLPEFDFVLENYKNQEYAWSLKDEVTYKEQPIQHISPKFVAIKWPVFCLEKLTNVNPELGPLMKSTGEAMTVGKTFEEAKKKWQDQDLSGVEVYEIN